MHITALKETGNEARVAISPAVVKNYIKSGFDVTIENHAGEPAGFSDETYQNAGAKVADRNSVLEVADLLLAVNEPSCEIIEKLRTDALIIASTSSDPDSLLVKTCLEKKISLLSMNRIPRITRAQSMDSLSSQANVAGYKAVLKAIDHYHRVVPMMMTAAGMIQPAKVLILGAGVAGLQATATAKRLGAVIYVFDVRKAAREQVESLGGEFIEVSDEDAATQSGYAGETSETYKKLQATLIDEYAQMADIIITTALIPDKKAPVLLYKDTVEKMKAGSVIVDLATSRGGNCEVSVPDETITHHHVTVIGNTNLASLVPTTASELYANNLMHLIGLISQNPGEITLNPDDEIISQSVLCHQGQYLPFSGQAK